MVAAEDFWDGIADKYARSPVRNEEAYAETLDRVRSYLRAEDRALELGCGTGSTALKLADAVASYTGTDISARMIAIARDKTGAPGPGRPDFAVADVGTAPGEGYDVVLAFNLLHLVRDQRTALDRIHGLLRPGGLFISKTPCLPTRGALGFRLLLLALPLMQLVGKAPFVRLSRIADWEGVVAGAGFEIIETGNYPARPPNRFLVARRV